MSEQIKKLAEFMGWKIHEYKSIEKVTLSVPDGKFHFRLHNSTDWNLWMLVEARLREKKLETKYINALYDIVYCYGMSETGVVRALMFATLEQRMAAALQVIQESNDG